MGCVASCFVNNYVNPVHCVATVCRQVRCMYWGHLGHFHWAISHLKWYKIVCMKYLACTFSPMKSINMFPCFWNLELPDISFGDLLRFEYITSLFSCLCMSMSTSNSRGNMQKHGYLGCFHAVSASENISGVWVIEETHTRGSNLINLKMQIWQNYGVLFRNDYPFWANNLHIYSMITVFMICTKHVVRSSIPKLEH